jgi:pimeloyl-ACP methyl ester carboxylesterase
MSRRTVMRRAVGLATLAGLGAAAWEVQRRIDARRLANDPEGPELARTLVGRTVDAVSADGTRLHAEVFGPEDAPTVVLAHGWTCSNQFWHYQIRDLSKDFRVVAYDQRGHGRSAAPQGGQYSPDALSDDLQAVLEACVPAGERCVVAGHSMGGMTIVSWAGRHAEEVQGRLAGAVLVSTGMGDLLAQLLVLRPRWAGRLHAALSPRVVALPARLPKNPTPISHRVFRYVAYGSRAGQARVAFG